MKLRREILPIVIALLFLMVARQIYPYAGVMVAKILGRIRTGNHRNWYGGTNLFGIPQ